MVFIKRIVLCLFLLAIKNIAFSQCNYVAGNTCSTAPVICDLNCLDGFQGSLFPESTVTQYLPEQPPLLCWDGSTGFGTPTNLSWFAFIAGCDTAIISVTPSNCIKGDGIQLGLFDDCDFMNTTIGPDLDVNEFIACNTDTPYPGPVLISATNLNPGQTYYFFVDGNNGDICDYTVNVIAACQADTLPNPKNFAGKTDTLETCPGTRFELKPVDFDYDIEYYWKIDPPTVTYPYANFTRLDSLTKWRISTPGIYNISMYAYNRCDATDTLNITVEIKEPDDEIFDLVTICQNEFPYTGPTDQDKNGDGIGWLGSIINTPGLYTHNVVRADGCRYDQIANVVQQNLQPREKVTLVDCNQVDYHGLSFTSNELNFPYTIPSLLDKNGCDSIVSIDAYILDLNGQFVPQSCTGGKVTIGYVINNISSPNGYQLSYEWRDGNGNLIPDNDTDVTNITLDKATQLNLTINLSVNEETCVFNQGPIQIDPTQQLPMQPVPNNWVQTICEDDAIQDFEIMAQSGILNYNWTVDNSATINGNNNSRNVIIDFSNVPFNTPTEICVSVENTCGESAQYCSTLRKIEKPTIEINSFDTICIDEELVVSTSNTSSATINNHNWTYSGGLLVSGNNNSAGPLTLRYNNPGIYNISAIASNAVCTSSVINKNVTVLPIVEKPILNYQPYADKVIITWAAVSCAQSYNCYINGTFIKNTFAQQLEIDGMVTNTSVNVTIEAIGHNCACGINAETVVAWTLSCTEVQLKLNSPSNIICEIDWVNPVQLNYNLIGNLGSGIFTWNGSNVNNTGVINPASLGSGNHQIFLQYDEFGCTYKDSIIIKLVPTPDAKIVAEDPECKEDEDGSVMVVPLNFGDKFDYRLDGKPMEQGNLQSIGIGNHNIQIIDANNCSIVKNFVINPPTYPDIELRKQEEPYYDNEILDFSIFDLNNNLDLIDSVVWLINGEVFCSGNCMGITLEDFESGLYNHQILVFYKNCEIRQDFEMQVKEAPKVFASNVFVTNNKDTENSGFKIMSNNADLEILSLDIFSRWGEKVFTKQKFIANSEQTLWDGRVNGEYVVPGVYMYKLSYKNEKDVIVTEIKDVTVVR